MLWQLSSRQILTRLVGARLLSAHAPPARSESSHKEPPKEEAEPGADWFEKITAPVSQEPILNALDSGGSRQELRQRLSDTIRSRDMTISDRRKPFRELTDEEKRKFILSFHETALTRGLNSVPKVLTEKRLQDLMKAASFSHMERGMRYVSVL